MFRFRDLVDREGGPLVRTARAGSPSSELVQRLLEVEPEVVDVLHADREPDEALGDDGSSPDQRRRRSKVDSTLPRLVAWVHRAQPSMKRSAEGASARSIESSDPKPG